MPAVSKQNFKKATPKKAGSVLDRLPSAWDLADTMSVLMYGRSGTGKTTLWATFPKPILAIIVSGGQKPGELRSINTPELRKVITPVVIRESTDVQALLAEAGNFATVVLDHASGLQDLVLKEVLGIEELPAQKSWGMASQQQYGQCTMQTKEILRAILNLPCHRVIIAQERDFNTESDSELILPSVGAALTPSLTGWLNPACDYIVNTFIRPRMEVTDVKGAGGKVTRIQKRGKGVEYCIRTAPHEVFTTKFRVPKGHPLPDVIVDASFSKIEALIKGSAK